MEMTAHSRICLQKGHYFSVYKNNKSRVREIKDEKEKQDFLGLVTLENLNID